MINSLFKDSHITQPFRHPNSSMPESSRDVRESRTKRKEYSCATVNNKECIIASKPAEISFSGLSSAKVVNEASLKNLVQKARTFLGEHADYKNVSTLINESVDVVLGTAKEGKGNLEKFLGLNKESVQSVIDDSQKYLREETRREVIKPEDLKNTINSAVEIYPTIEKKHHGIYSNKFVKNFLEMAANSQAVFNATFSIGLTCILRPAAIMSLPGNKKDKDNKKYASAHSIASGVIAYLLSLAIFSPIANSMKKLEKHPNYFMNKFKNLEYLKDPNSMKAAKKYINMLPEAIFAMPKAALTVALIPPILKYVFGWEKKKGNKNEVDSFDTNYALLNFRSQNMTSNHQILQNFTGESK